MRRKSLHTSIGLLGVIVLVMFACQSGPHHETVATSPSSTGGYDSALAKRLGADDYGMKPYIMAYLKRGEVTVPDSVRMTLQRGHLSNIKRLANEGKLVLAGPFMDTGQVRGIFIFDVETVEEAERLVATDPAIKAGTLEVTFRPWYGSAGLLKLNELHSKIAKETI